MKIVNMALCLTTAGLMLSANAFAADNAAGSLNTTGQIVASTCIIDQGVLDKTVTLSNFNVTDISSVSAGSQLSKTATPFEFQLTSCPVAVTDVGIKFNYNADSTGGDGYLENSNATPATGVALGITNLTSTTPITNGSIIHADSFSAVDGSSPVIHAKVAAYRVGTTPPKEGGITSISQVVVSYP